MIDRREKQKDIIELIAKLDITPTMYKNAVEKYKALAQHLEGSGIKADIYPQGSFAIGTVVRPSVVDPNAYYDLDFICQLDVVKDSVAPSELRQTIKNALIDSQIYKERLEFDENCFTITYADVDDIGFKIDVVPAADESAVTKRQLQNMSVRPDLISTAIAIPRCTQEKNYLWITSNPRGIRTWFDEINRPFALFSREERRQTMFRENRSVFDSVEAIPEALERSSLQRVIQILKRHRDVYYARLQRSDIEELKPISAIITVVVSQIAKSAAPQLGVFDLLEYTIRELSVYSERLKLNDDMFARTYGARSLINRENGKWKIRNPSNPEDNLADRWNTNKEAPKFFFMWLNACKQDLILSMSLSDSEFRRTMENAFGSASVQKVWADKYKLSADPAPRPIITTAKPYRA